MRGYVFNFISIYDDGLKKNTVLPHTLFRLNSNDNLGEHLLKEKYAIFSQQFLMRISQHLQQS